MNPSADILQAEPGLLLGALWIKGRAAVYSTHLGQGRIVELTIIPVWLRGTS